METKESFMTIVTEINDVTSSCTSVANKCVELFLSQMEVEDKDINAALSNTEFQAKLKELFYVSADLTVKSLWTMVWLCYLFLYITFLIRMTIRLQKAI